MVHGLTARRYGATRLPKPKRKKGESVRDRYIAGVNNALNAALRARHRGGGSVTTRRRKKIGHKAVECRAGSESMFGITIRPKGLANKLASKLTHLSWNVNDKGAPTTTAGIQNFAEIGSIFNPSHCGTMLNQVINTEFGTNNTIVGGGGGTIPNPLGYQTISVNYKSCFAEFMITNSDNACARIVIYDIIQKRDAYQDANAHSLSTTNAIQYGINEQSGSTTQWQTIGTRPFDSNLFNQFYKVKRITYACLSPGQTHIHQVKYLPNKKMNADVIRASNQLLTGTAGFTYKCLVQFSGVPVPDNGAVATTQQVKLLTVSRYDYKFNYLPGNITNTIATNNLSTTVGTNFENTESATATVYVAAA